jgi:hypothetical protein
MPPITPLGCNQNVVLLTVWHSVGIGGLCPTLDSGQHGPNNYKDTKP